MERLQRTRLLSVAVLGVVLASGVLLGLALNVRLDGSGEPGDDAPAVSEDARDDERGERRRPMYRQVGDLSVEQDARIDSIIDEHRESMRALQREFSEAWNPRYWSIIENTRESIKSVLTPDQALRYDSLLAEYDRRRRHKDEGSDERRK